MSVATKPLAKSLHTVTALVRVAQLIKRHVPATTNENAIEGAADALGYYGAADPYNLKALALKQLAVAS